MASKRKKSKSKPLLSGNVRRLRRLAKEDPQAALSQAKATIRTEQILRRYGSLDALKTTSKRRRPRVQVQSLDCEFSSQGDREKMIATVRDLELNWQLLRGIAGIHCNNVVGTGPHIQVRSEDDDWNERKEAYFHQWERRCDVTGIRHFAQYVYNAFRRMRVDGDVGILFLKNMKMQAFESEQIGNPPPAKGRQPTTLPNGRKLIYGVETDRALKPLKYHLWSSEASCRNQDMYIGAKAAGQFVHLFDPERFRQSRGISSFIAAINDHQDLREAFEAVKGTIKLENILGVGIESAAAEGQDEDFGFLGKRTDYDVTNADGDNETRKEIKMEQGLQVLELGEGEKIHTIEKKTPGPNFESWAMLQIRFGALAFHMPLELAFMYFTRGSFSSLKGAIGQYHQVVTIDRQRLEAQFLDRVQAWVTRAGIRLYEASGGQAGLQPPTVAGVDPVAASWQWDALPLLEPDKQIDADIKEYKAGVTTLTDMCARRNRDFDAVSRRKAQELKDLERIEQEEEVPPGTLAPQVGVPGEPESGGNGGDGGGDDDED